MKLSPQIKNRLRQALQEDLGRGDITAKVLIPGGVLCRAVIQAKSDGVFFGKAVVQYLLKTMDPDSQVRCLVCDGQAFKKNQILINLRGKQRAVLGAERTLLNVVSHLCGVAALTSQFVKQVRPWGVQVLDTRKTTPLWRELEKQAVLAGGGRNHRMGLYDEIFVKENHRGFKTLAALKKYARKFVIEVRNQIELEEALLLKPRVILLDNYSISDLKQAVRFAHSKDRRVLLEASGGITLKNAVRIAQTGIDQISIGALTHSAPGIDLSLLVLR